VVISSATHLYLDHRQEPDPEDRGLYWATAFTDTKKVFGFMPGDIPANADRDTMGNIVTQEDVCGAPGCPLLKKPENIIGKYIPVDALSCTYKNILM